MNIQVQCCGLVLLCFLVYFTICNKHLGLYTERIFLRIISADIVCVSLDILSIVAISCRIYIREWLLELICKMYVSSLVYVAYLALCYVLTDLYPEHIYKVKVKKYTVAVIFSMIVVFILPIYYFHEGRVVYTYGGSVLSTYCCAILFILNASYYIIRYYKKINEKRIQAIFVWMITLLVATIIQFFNNEWLLVGYAISLTSVILFFILENPKTNIDRQFGCFNSYALTAFMKHVYLENKSYSIMIMSYSHYHESNIENMRIIEHMLKLANYIKSYKNVKVFKDVEAQLVLLFHSKEELDQLLMDIEHKHYDIDLQPHIFVMYDSRCVKNESEFFRLFKYYNIRTKMIEENKVFYLTKERVEVFHHKEEICSMIIDAIEHDKILIYYQPIFSTKTKKFVSAEALVRIQGKDGKLVLPGEFIEIAEEYKLIRQLGEIVFEKTCIFLVEEKLEEYGLQHMDVNLSVVQCENQNLAKRYIDIMNKYKLNPSLINLEITETALISSKNIMIYNMEQLLNIGVAFSLDDFGNGQSNLNYIVNMPFHIVKLDMSLIKNYFINDKAKLIVESSIKMVHDMGLEIVAEGVETEEQYNKMVEIGIDYIQGYYFSKPLSQAKYLDYLKENNK